MNVWTFTTSIDPVYWLVSILWPQRMFVVYNLTLLEGCTQAIMVEDCFSNFGNIGSYPWVYFWRFWSSVKFIWPMLWFTKELNTCVGVAYGPNDLCRLKRSTTLSWIPPKVTILHGSQWRKFFRQSWPWRASIRKCLDQISSTNVKAL
jgi:hypothetical protein